MEYYGGEDKKKDVGTMLAGCIGAGVWWFLSSEPSTFALILAAVFLTYLFLGYCVLAVWLPDPNDAPKSEAFVPLQTDYNRPKALTL